MVNSDIIVSKPHKQRKRTTKKTNKLKVPTPKKKPKTVVVPNTSPRISDDEDIFFSQILAKKDTAKEKIHKSIEKATAVMADTKLEIQKCPFCKKYSASYNMRQTRSGDEGATAEFKCSNELCGRSWRGRS
jgi:DNA-directed RNA polymerase subunit M/transcription elongation factor TFIIS